MRTDDWTACLEALGQLTALPLVLARPDGDVLAATPDARGLLGVDGSALLSEAFRRERPGWRCVDVSVEDGSCQLCLPERHAGGLRGAVHDLRGALNALTLQLDLMRAGLDEQGLARAEAAAREVRRMAALLDGLGGKNTSGTRRSS